MSVFKNHTLTIFTIYLVVVLCLALIILTPYSTSNPKSVLAATSSSSAQSSIQTYTLNFKINLSSYYNPNRNIMNTGLRNKSLLSTVQPYSPLPWNYKGSESIPDINSNSVYADVVDWILIDFKDPNTNQVLFSKAALLRKYSDVQISNIIPGSYNLVIRHRNHLAIATINPVNINSNFVSLDFTRVNGNNLLKGHNQNEITNDIFALRGSDINGDGVVDASDRNLIKNTPEQNNVISLLDVTGDGLIDASDRNFVRNATEATQLL